MGTCHSVLFYILCLSCFSFLAAIDNVVCVQIFETVATLALLSCEIIYGNTVHYVKICNFHLGNIFVECDMTIWYWYKLFFIFLCDGKD